MMFFQAVLLLGYLYAHLSDRLLSIRGQMLLHLGVVVVAACLLPIAVPEDWLIDDPERPVASLLSLLLISVGGPFFALSANATLLQRWFSSTSHASASDPYFLYAVSNAGSMLGLLSYPLLVEPNFGLSQQTRYWAFGFGILAIGLLACVVTTMRFRKRSSESLAAEHVESALAITWRQRATWVLLAAIPSSWLLSVTTRLTTDIAPIPLLWVVPLAIYLLTFVLVFASRKWITHRQSKQWMAALAVLLVAAIVAPSSTWLAALHLLSFFVGAMLCHGELVQRRPGPSGLTEFYLWLSVGGVAGGFFNSIIAPNVFTVLLEFGIAVSLACLFTRPENRVVQEPELESKPIAPKSVKKKPKRRKAILETEAEVPAKQSSLFNAQLLQQHWPFLVVAVLSVVMLRGVSSDNANSSAWVTLVVVLLIPTLIALYVARYTVAFALLVGASLMVDEYDGGPQYDVVHRARSFFGRHLVVDDSEAVGASQNARYRRLLHGNTQHGFQSLDPARVCEPLAYYHRTGPLGDIFTTFQPQRDGANPASYKVAAIGLGTGAVACYAGQGCEITFVEVDPAVRDIASDDGYFSYLSQCGRDHCEIVMADGRQAMEAASDKEFDLIFLDAFSSDAVPTHLMTREAILTYINKLADDGVVAFHISNKYLRLDRVLTAAAEDLRLASRVKHDRYIDEQDRQDSVRIGKADAWYFVIAKDQSTLESLPADWETPENETRVRVWTDDYSNILSVMQFWR